MSGSADSLSAPPSRPRSVRLSGSETPREDILRSLETHDGQVGGHAGVMRSGSLIVKPCTQAEIEFYALATQTAPLFAAWMPTYMGQLTLNKPGVDPLQALRESARNEGAFAGKEVSSLLESERFEQAIVLENLEWGFRRPSVLDVKLGRVLTDEDCEEEKRIRLQRSSQSTTSWEHHLRLTGMRVWDPEQQVHIVYPKAYGKSLTTATLPEGFQKFFSSLQNPTHERLIIQRLIADTEAIHNMLSSHETRMYAASILYVYEGDTEALETGIQSEAHDEVIEEEDDGEDEEEEPQYISKTKLIDFAHASFRQGEGADRNAIPGVENVLKHLKMLLD